MRGTVQMTRLGRDFWTRPSPFASYAKYIQLKYEIKGSETSKILLQNRVHDCSRSPSITSVLKFQLRLSLKLQLKLIRNLAKVSMKFHVKFHSNLDKHETSIEDILLFFWSKFSMEFHVYI